MFISNSINYSNCSSYSNYPNLLLIVKSNRKIDDNEIKKPNIINGFDLSLTFLEGTLVDKDTFLALSLFRRFEKNLLTLKIDLVNN